MELPELPLDPVKCPLGRNLGVPKGPKAAKGVRQERVSQLDLYTPGFGRQETDFPVWKK